MVETVMVNVLLDGLLDAFFGALGRSRRAGRGLDPTLWRGPELSRWTIAAAVAVFLPLIPLAVAVTRFAVVALRLADDPMLFFFGLLFALPAALMAMFVLVMAGTAALWLAAALLGGRLHARLYAAAYGVAGLVIGVLFVVGGLHGHGVATVATSAALLAVLLPRR